MYSKTKKVISITVILTLVLTAGCFPGPKEHEHADRAKQAGCSACNAKLLSEKGYREITIEELEAIQKSNEPSILINVLPFYYYRKEHIVNSISIPVEEIENSVPKLFKKDAKIILYCQSYHCKLSPEASEKLAELGYTHVLDYKGGVDEWKEKGNKVAGLKTKSKKKKK